MNAFAKAEFDHLFRVSISKVLETEIHSNHPDQKESESEHQSEAVLAKANGVREGNGNGE